MQDQQQSFSGPYLQVAALCEKVLIEKDGTYSLIRFVDRINIVGPAPEMPPTQIAITLFISMKAGFYRGKASLKITPESPDRSEMPSMTFPLLFEGDDERGTFVQANMRMQIKDEGTYWFAVAQEGQGVLTRVPLRVLYQQRQFATQPVR